MIPSPARISDLPLLLLILTGLSGTPLLAQEVTDTLPRPDSLLAVEDTILQEEADSGVIRVLPRLIDPHPTGIRSGIWQWDRYDLLSSRALTLAELLAEIPGVLPIRAGDYGMPVAVTAFAVGAGRVRVFIDGVEMLPLEGGTTDLTRIGLGGMELVRARRSAGGIRIDMETLVPNDPRPYSQVEAGTGDLSTNLFRGTFVHPSALGGSVSLVMERLDTQGPGGGEPGSFSGAWIRYSYLRGENVGLAVDFRRMSSGRGELQSPADVTRSDWTMRSRVRLTEGVVAEGFIAQASLKAEEADTFLFKNETRGQWGGRLSVDRERVWGTLAARRLGAEGLPDWEVEAEIGGDLWGYGGVSASLARESWSTGEGTRNHIRLWTEPVYGLSAFAEIEGGQRGIPYLPPPDPVPDTTGGAEGGTEPPTIVPRLVDRSATRFGAQFQWRGLSLSGARLSFEADSIHSLGLVSDVNGLTLPGETRTGYEVLGRIPLLADGLSLVGSYQWWDPLEAQIPEGDEPTLWPYLPDRIYKASVSYHNTFFQTENLELWADIGVQGRDGMALPLLDPEADPLAQTLLTVPWYQSWYGRLQVRVVTVHVFIMWENFTLRRENQDYPGRLLPATRALYGVRWSLWN